ncbi:MAG TPA: amidohydrolase family protein [Candidatus Methylomirabilis sp.]|nr:amidohydrolase family protein [Candidatus Methylomirabilis sp.]
MRADCHAHIIVPTRFPYADGPGYRPRPDEAGDCDDFRRVLLGQGMTHALLVQPSCYGYDNACLLDAMGRSGGRFKGVGMVPPSVSEAELLRLKERGIVGVRLHLMLFDPKALVRPDAGRFLARMKEAGLFVQVYARGDVWAGALAPLKESGVQVVVDHFGEPDPERGLDQPGFQAVLALGRDSDAVVKLSAAFRTSRQPFPHADVEPFVTAAIQAYGVDRCVWGSDWPFINTTQQVDYGRLLHGLGRWLPEADDRDRVLWQNPIRLCGFTENV